MKMLPVGVPPKEGLLALVGGVAAALAFPPLTLWFLAPVSLALLLRLLRDQNVETARNLGLLYGLGLAGGTMYWFFSIFHVFTMSLMAIMAGYFGVLGNLIALTRAMRPTWRVLLVSVFGVGIEWLRGDAWYLRFPWYTVPHALAAEPACIAGARWLGAYGLSFFIWLVAAGGAFVRFPLWAGFLLLPAFSLLLPEPDAPRRRALLIQTEVTEGVERLIPTIPDMEVDLAVLPEYAYFSSYRSALASKQGPAALAQKLSCPVIFGAVDGSYGSKDFRNIAVIVGPDGQQLGEFQKQRPVPLMRDGVAGSERPVFPVEQGVLGVAICYDFDNPDIAASLVQSGATVLVAPTFDAMHWTRIQHIHHSQLQRLRAVETDRWLVRAASSGRSESIDPLGRPSGEGVEIGKVGYVVVPFDHRDTWTLATRLYWLGPACMAGTVGFVVWWFVRGRRARTSLQSG